MRERGKNPLLKFWKIQLAKCSVGMFRKRNSRCYFIQVVISGCNLSKLRSWAQLDARNTFKHFCSFKFSMHRLSSYGSAR